MIVNMVVLVSLVIFTILAIRAEKNPQHPMWHAWFVIPAFIWGFWGFRRLLEAFSSLTGMIFFANLRAWGIIYILGSLLVGAFSFLVIPFLLVADIVRLIRIRSIK
jgi:hypothetical protein